MVAGGTVMWQEGRKTRGLEAGVREKGNVENASAEKQKRDKEYTLRVQFARVGESGRDDSSVGGNGGGGSGRVERDAKKKRALHSRFNRKTSFIRSFIIIKEPWKLPALVPRGREKDKDSRRKEKKSMHVYARAWKRDRKKEIERDRESKREKLYDIISAL